MSAVSFGRWLVGEATEGLVSRECVHLRARGICNFVTPMTDVDAPKAGSAVEILIAIDVPNVRTFAAVDYELTTLNLGHVRKWMPEARFAGQGVPQPWR